MEADWIGWREGLLLFLGLIAGFLLASMHWRWRERKKTAQGPAQTPPVPAGNAIEQDGAAAGAFDQQLAAQLTRYDFEREIAKLHEEVAKLRKEVAELRASRNVSPHYAEALGLAQRGLSAQEIADRMGISLAEAELVYALSRGEELFKERELDDGVWQSNRRR